MTAPTLTKLPVNERQVETNITPQHQARMKMDQGALDHLLSLLTDLYSDPYLAILREYSTNALDSHIAAGNDAPIEITLPSMLSPTYIVKDHGVGMSLNDIERFYGMYGASSKREDLDQSGAFGIGGKSALTLVDQFTLVAVKDGYKSTVLVSKDSAGVGTLNVLSHVKTQESNGVKVSIPIPNVDRFLKNVPHFFAAWKPGTVLVDGEQPESIYSDSERTIREGEFIFRFYDPLRRGLNGYGNRNDNKFFVVMGSIVYPVTMDAGELFGRREWGYYAESNLRGEIFLEVPIGAVDLVGSREAMRYTKRTRDYLVSRFSRFLPDVLPKMALQQVARQDSVDKAYGVIKEWVARSVFGVTTNGKFVTRDNPAERAPYDRLLPPTPDACVVSYNGKAVPAWVHAGELDKCYSYTSRYQKMSEVKKQSGGSPYSPRITLAMAHLYTNADPNDPLGRRVVVIKGKEDDPYAERSDAARRNDIRTALIHAKGMEGQDFGVYVLPTVEEASEWITSSQMHTVITLAEVHRLASAHRAKNPRATTGETTRNLGQVRTYNVLTLNAESCQVTEEPLESLKGIKFYLAVEDIPAAHRYAVTSALRGLTSGGLLGAYDASLISATLRNFGFSKGDRVILLRRTQRLSALKNRIERAFGDAHTLTPAHKRFEQSSTAAFQALSNDDLRTLWSVFNGTTMWLCLLRGIYRHGLVDSVTSEPIRSYLDDLAWLILFLEEGRLPGMPTSESDSALPWQVRGYRYGSGRISIVATAIEDEMRRRNISTTPTFTLRGVPDGALGRMTEALNRHYPMAALLLNEGSRGTLLESLRKDIKAVKTVVEYINSVD